jgi:Tfp pilus assembly protein PilF
LAKGPTPPKSLASSRLKRYVGGLAALSALSPDQAAQAIAAPPPAPVPRQDESASPTAATTRRTTERALAEVVERIRREDWARAQRLLEDALRREHDEELAHYLDEVRAVRRIQRQLSRWPRDAMLRLELGRLYFGLELGEQAADEFRRVVALEPTLPDGHFYLALEHLFRGEEALSRESLARAAELRPGVPSFESLRDTLYQSGEEQSA